MGLNCGCPLGQSIPSLSVAQCKEGMGQIQKLYFQRVYKESGVKNEMTLPLVKATVQALTAASDGTKLTVSPFIMNPATEPGAARTFGGGNQTLGGIEIIIGREPTTFSGLMYEEDQATIKVLKEYMCENIGVFLIDEYGNIGCIKLSETPGEGQADPTIKVGPIPIGKLFIGDKKIGGYEEPDSNSIEFNFYPNWSDDFMIIKCSDLGFNPLTDITNPDD